MRYDEAFNHCENEVIANNSCYQLADVQLMRLRGGVVKGVGHLDHV